jgi:hypothetical protein
VTIADVLLSCLGPLVYCLQNFKLFDFQFFDVDEGYSRNVLYALN